MAITTYGNTGNTLSGTITSFAGSSKNFTAKVGDLLAANCISNNQSTVTQGIIMANGGNPGNSFCIDQASSATSYFSISAPLTSLTISPGPFYRNCFSTGATVSNTITSIAGDGNNTILLGNSAAAQTTLQYSTNNGTTLASTGTLTSGTWNHVFYDSSNSRWYAVSSNTQAAYSTNLASAWTASTGGTWSGNWLWAAAGGGNVVAITTNTTGLNYSTNGGATYTNIVAPIIFKRVRYVNGQFVAWGGGNVSTVYTSPTGATWTARSITFSDSFITAATIDDVVYGNGVYYMNTSATNSTLPAPDGQITITSTDGITWTAQSYFNLGYRPSVGGGWYFDGKYFHYVSGTNLYTSPYPCGYNNVAKINIPNAYSPTSIVSNIVYQPTSNTYVYASTATNITANKYTPSWPVSYYPGVSITNLSQTTYAGTI